MESNSPLDQKIRSKTTSDLGEGASRISFSCGKPPCYEAAPFEASERPTTLFE
jgi:hypothetical protein